MTADPHSTEQTQLTLTPIGHFYNARKVKFEAPAQPEESFTEAGLIKLLPGRGFERALKDLAGFERIWLVWWFNRNQHWRPLVCPPRGDGTRRGVFATRSPHRPNPIGITAVKLLGVSGLELQVGCNDLLSGTPILDIKPYITSADAFAECRCGWVSEMEKALAAAPKYKVKPSPLAAEQLAWLERRWRVSFIDKAIRILQMDPRPHRTRRISRLANGRRRLACGPWRLDFSVADMTVTIELVRPGYPAKLLNETNSASGLPDREAQISFNARWSDELSRG